MAVPSSGELSLNEIFAELYANDYGGWSNYEYDGYTPSLLNLSTGGDPPDEAINTNNSSANRPNGTAPHNMSEFYSYNHDEPSGGGPKK